MTKKEISPEDAAVGRRIVKLRKELNLDSQQVFADQLGNVTRGAVGNWERGAGIKRENLQRIAKVFGVSFDWLATGRGSMRPDVAPDEPNPSEEEFLRLWGGADEDVKRSALILLRGGQKTSKD